MDTQFSSPTSQSRSAPPSRALSSSSSSGLDRVLPTPRLVEVDTVDLAVSPAKAWDLVRNSDLGQNRIAKALFAIRTLPTRLFGAERAGQANGAETTLRLAIDDLRSTPEKPGFQILVDAPPGEIVIGAIGKVWQLDIPFHHVDGAEAFASVIEPGWVKVAWAIRVEPLGDADARIHFEVRVDATDDASFAKFQRYFLVIGPGSHFIRRALLDALAREYGTPDSREEDRPLPGDELLPHAGAMMTHGITIAAPPEAIWPWLMQMGCRRAGYYSIDELDNGWKRSAREIHPDLQDVKVGDYLPATPTDGEGQGFEVLRLEPNRLLVLGGLHDTANKKQLPFAAAAASSSSSSSFWQITWAFVLEKLDERSTRLHVRARAAFPPDGELHAALIQPVHHLMEWAQLRHLAARVEGRLSPDDWRDILEGTWGAAVMVAALFTPFLRGARNHWGVDAEYAAGTFLGDALVPNPTWAWTHAVEIDATAEEVWPWIAQIGADRAGFYSYQWLENIVGCDLRNAETIHREWAITADDSLQLHPKAPRLPVAALEPGRAFVVYGSPEPAKAAGKPWVAMTWLFLVEPIDDDDGKRCRFVSRYRCACSDDFKTHLQFGPALIEPIGFAMDRRMLLGVKQRVESAAHQPTHE